MSGEITNEKRPFLSLSMIVKNEEKYLVRCLDSAKDLVDEIVIVDTGSTDRTIEIALSYGAKIHHFPWIDDFAAARNFALDRTTGTWVLHLDGDEVAVVTGDQDPRDELAGVGPEVMFMRIPVRNLRPDGMGHDIYGGRRIFRNSPDVRWIRRIHETITHLHHISWDMDKSMGSLVIDHDGYAYPTERASAGKLTRNMRMLKNELKENPDDATLYYYLSVEYSNKGRYSLALSTVLKGIKRFSGRLRPDLEGAMRCHAMRYAMAIGKIKLAITLGVEQSRLYAFSELCYLLGSAYMRDGDLERAEQQFDLAIVLKHRFAEFQLDAGSGSWKPQIELGAVAILKGDLPLAEERMRRAYSWAPDQALTNTSLSTILLMSHKPEEGLKFARRALEIAPTMRIAHLRTCQALAILDKKQDAYDHLDSLTRTYPDVPEYWEWLGDLLFEIGEYEECVHVLGRAISIHQKSAAIYNRLGAALRHIGRNQDSLNAFALAAAIDPKSEGARIGLAMAAHAVEWRLTALPS